MPRADWWYTFDLCAPGHIKTTYTGIVKLNYLHKNKLNYSVDVDFYSKIKIA